MLERNFKISCLVAILTFLAMIITQSNLLAEGAEKMNPKKVIFETDMSTDVDDGRRTRCAARACR